MRRFPLNGTWIIVLALAVTWLVFFPGVAETKKAEKAKAVAAPISVSIEAQKQIFSRREGLMVSVEFKAREPARLCFQKDPMTQFKFKVIRSGQGELDMAPLVTQDRRVLFGQKPRIFHLDSGDRYTYRLNLKRIQFMDGEKWVPGDYNVSATFWLCEQREDDHWAETDSEQPVKAMQNARFMIMN